MRWPLLNSAAAARPILWSQGRAIRVEELLSSVHELANRLPGQSHAINLCEHRHAFLAAFCAALLRGQTNLLPSSRAQAMVDEVRALYPDSYVCDDAMVQLSNVEPAVGNTSLNLPGDQLVVIGFTSGSTGQPQRHAKRWHSLRSSNACNAARIRECLQPEHAAARPWIVATVPSQHMYGVETSVLLPLIGDMAIHAARPLFPADVAAALAEIPTPRILVTTPVHLRALMGSAQRLPQLALVISATAPLDRELALDVEIRCGARLLEMFGSTETCVIATRQPAREDAWHLYPQVTLEPHEEGTMVSAPWFETDVLLQDILEPLSGQRFVVRGRNADMVEVAGKRASLADLTRRLLSLPGVQDAIAFQPNPAAAGVVRRVAALAVAPGLTAESLCEQLAHSVDAAFIPRPLVLVSALPRNESGKLPHESLLAALRSARVSRA